jgi:hypothetical protein
MESEAFLKRADEIMETICCWESLEDEVLKLYALFTHCATIKHEAQELVNVNYVREKIFNLLIKHPIIMSGDAKRTFISMKIEKEAMQHAMREDDNGHD